MNLKLHLYPDEILRQKCLQVDPTRFGSEELSKKISEMFEIMKKDGIGLAGPQAGLLDRIFIVDLTADSSGKNFIAFDLNDNNKPVENKRLVIINPEIEWKSKEMNVSKEGCLSLPGILVWVNRPKKIKLRFFDEKGVKYFFEMDSLLAKCCQHEIDHLNGKMIIDYKNFIVNSFSDKKKIDKALIDLEKKFCK